ncbi:MAG: nitrite reductase [Betaproteobacteria bacterium]|nr:nitrite reductase [Betaproteobacteria bacterium]MDH5221974.1 nitrite reductase [Betaproteobacteria bacterium]MDH5350145.1 nitrite reductase [Betaproteobacteria bacterium]
MRALVAALLLAPALALPQDLYQQHCASCHGDKRLGGMGPALLPENLSRLKKPQAARMIRDSRPGVQMPAFAGTLSDAQVAQLVEQIYTPLSPAPAWGEADIHASRVVHHAAGTLPAKPQFKADPLNLFVVVEAGDHHATILDGDRLEPIHRFATRFALHGGPKFSPDGRFVYFASRDGWISKFDLWNLKTVAEVRAGINTRNAAVSGDGKYVMVANYLPHSLVVLDADLELVKVLQAPSRVSAVYDAAPRRSFIAAMKDAPELWEISYDPKAEAVATGLVHDYRLKEGAFVPGFLNPRRTPLEDVLDDFFFTPDFRQVIGASRDGKRGQVVHLDVRRAIATVDLPGLPHLGSGISWQRQGRRVMATPNLREAVVSVIDVADWKTVAQVKTLGAGFFLRSHENVRTVWVDSMIGPKGRDTLQVIDKESLEVVAQLAPVPGKTLAHIEFDRYGRYALASLWEDDGALIVFDAQTLAEVKRIPMKKPVGKYNVFNKISRSEGTSH